MTSDEREYCVVCGGVIQEGEEVAEDFHTCPGADRPLPVHAACLPPL